MIGIIITTSTNDWERLANAFDVAANTLLDATAERIVEHIETAMELPKSGRQYGTHIASQAGEPPAIETADLVESSQIATTGDFERTITYTSDHAVPMEFGTVHVAPRPFLTPGIESERPRFADGISTLLER